MKRSISIAIIILLFSMPACADEWTKKDTAFQASLLVLKGIDWLQTKEIARNPHYYEVNPILGKYPSQNRVDLYFACSAIGHTVVAYYLPSNYRRIWQCIFIGIQVGCIGHNVNAGVRIKF